MRLQKFTTDQTIRGGIYGLNPGIVLQDKIMTGQGQEVGNETDKHLVNPYQELCADLCSYFSSMNEFLPRSTPYALVLS